MKNSVTISTITFFMNRGAIHEECTEYEIQKIYNQLSDRNVRFVRLEKNDMWINKSYIRRFSVKETEKYEGEE